MNVSMYACTHARTFVCMYIREWMSDWVRACVRACIRYLKDCAHSREQVECSKLIRKVLYHFTILALIIEILIKIEILWDLYPKYASDKCHKWKIWPWVLRVLSFYCCANHTSSTPKAHILCPSRMKCVLSQSFLINILITIDYIYM